MKNKDYWNLRAKKNKQKIKSTTNFNLIKEFEISILKYLFEKYLKKKSLKIFELGCGNGVNLKSLKTIFPKFEFYGIDYSKGLDALTSSNIAMPNIFYPQVTNQLFYLGFIPGIFATVLGTMLASRVIYKREMAQLFKELEV